MSRVYWDTMLFAYWFEDHPKFGPRAGEIWAAMEARKDQLCSSVLTLGEVLTGPYKRGAKEAVNAMRGVLLSPRVELISFTAETADTYARIRADHRIAPADAIHLATAAQAGVDLFLTNDDRLKGLVIPGIDFIAGMDVSLF